MAACKAFAKQRFAAPQKDFVALLLGQHGNRWITLNVALSAQKHRCGAATFALCRRVVSLIPERRIAVPAGSWTLPRKMVLRAIREIRPLADQGFKHPVVERRNAFTANAGLKNSFAMRFSSVHIQKRSGKGHLLRLLGDWIDRLEAVVKNSVSPLNLG